MRFKSVLSIPVLIPMMAGSIFISQSILHPTMATANTIVAASVKLNSNQLAEIYRELAFAAEEHALQSAFFLNTKFSDQLRSLQMTNEAQAQAFMIERIQFLLDGVANGFVKPELMPDKVTIKNKKSDFRTLANNLFTFKITAKAALDSIAPKHIYYKRAVELHNQIKTKKASSWTPIPVVKRWPLLRPGVEHDLIPYLRARLNDFNYMADREGGAILNQELEQVLRQFQDDHNLEIDGIIGPNTWAMLNRTPEQLLSMTILNADRLRWIPQTLGKTHGFVNLAANKLEYVKNEQLDMYFRVISGRLERETPIMIDRMSFLEINPTWTVPFSIFVKDKLEQIRKDPNYIQKQRMVLIDNATKQIVDPNTIDWSTVDQTNLNYTLVQSPGPWNALGFLKFPLANPFAIFLHDTSDRHLFEAHMRFLSSGCIRLEKPFEFAERVIDDPKWTAETLRAATEQLPADTLKTQRIHLKQRVPLYLMYQTADLKPDGRKVFVVDTYSIDQATWELMRQL